MDSNRLTQKTQEALLAAQQESVRREHSETDGEHLLLALLTQTDGLIPRLLHKADANVEDIVRVVEMTDRKTGTKVHTNVSANDPASLLPLQEALGYDLAQSLFGQQRNLVMEGLTDYWYVEAVAHLLRDAIAY